MNPLQVLTVTPEQKDTLTTFAYVRKIKYLDPRLFDVTALLLSNGYIKRESLSVITHEEPYRNGKYYDIYKVLIKVLKKVDASVHQKLLSMHNLTMQLIFHPKDKATKAREFSKNSVENNKTNHKLTYDTFVRENSPSFEEGAAHMSVGAGKQMRNLLIPMIEHMLYQFVTENKNAKTNKLSKTATKAVEGSQA